MLLLADENVHPVVVERLRAAGYRVEWIAQTMPSAHDEVILERPDIGASILITYDRDFGDLIINQGYPAPYAVLYSRLGRANPRTLAERLVIILEEGVPAHHIVTITPDGERLRRFQETPSRG